MIEGREDVTLTPIPWTPMAHVLEQLMSDLSEECWCAGWLSDTELDVWALLEGESKSNVWYADGDELAKFRAVLAGRQLLDRLAEGVAPPRSGRTGQVAGLLRGPEAQRCLSGREAT